MKRYKSKKRITGGLMAVLALACLPGTAVSGEKTLHLGVVNGQVKDNQQVEVIRTLSDPVLFASLDEDNLPTTLRIRNASARGGDKGVIWVTVSKMLAGGKVASVTFPATLWVDGQRQAASYRDEGNDVVIAVSGALKQVMLRSDAPVTLAVPQQYRGELSLAMDIEGAS